MNAMTPDSRRKKPPLTTTELIGVGVSKQPTAAYPGTREKLRVMAERAERGQSLFHPNDQPMDATYANLRPKRAG